jgi:predicted HAD superfamily Cof-like phosphohydrolase
MPLTPTVFNCQVMVRAFHKRALPPNITFADQLHKLVEEVGELHRAHLKVDRHGVIDALADTLYVLLGLANLSEVDLEKAFLAVHQSNMTKTRDGTLSPRGGDYRPPEVGQ